MSVGVVIPDVENPLFGPIIAGAESVLGEEGYSVLVGNAEKGGIDTEEVVTHLLGHRVDGLLVAAAAKDDRWLSDLQAQGVPTVLVNRSVEGSSLPSIVCDDHTGVGLAVQHLVDLGHRRIGHVAGPTSVSTGMSRLQAFVSWMRILDLAPRDDEIEEAAWFQVEPGRVAALALLGRHPDLSAIVAGNDLIALGCYQAIGELGLEVGTDVSVTGYNDIPLLEMMQPSMTTVRVPYRQLGARGAATLLDLLRDPAAATAPMKLSPNLVVRGSTAPA